MEKIRPAAVEAAFLENAAPDTVYEYVRDQFKLDAPLEGPFSGQIQTSLLARRSLIIDLALAQFSDNDDVIAELVSRGKVQLRIAAFSNENRLKRFALMRDEETGRLPIDIFKKLISEGSDDELAAFFQNPEFSKLALAAVFARDELYRELSDERWMWIVLKAITNPNLQTETHERFDDGWGRYSKSKPFMEAYKLPLLVEPTPDWAVVLEKGISSFTDWSPDSSLALEMSGEQKPDPSSEDFHTVHKRGERRYLELVFERWKRPEEEDKDDRYGTDFDRLREAIASKVNYFDNELIDWMIDHPDVWVRRGAYKNFEPRDEEQLDEFYKRDKFHFLEAAAFNKNLYTNYSARTAKISRKFNDLVYYGKLHLSDPDGLDYDLCVIGYERELNKLHLLNADQYPDDPDDFLKWEEDETTDEPDPLEKASAKIETLREEISEAASGLAQREDMHEISQMIDKLSDMTEQIREMLNDVGNENSQTSRDLNAISSGISGVSFLIKLALWGAIAFAIFNVVNSYI